jgi:hypothetical protein
MAQWDKAPEPSVARTPGADSDLERDLRRFCERADRLTPDLARDVLFWLDLGEEPRDVARWLLEQLEVGGDASRDPSVRQDSSLFPPDERTDDAGERSGCMRKRRRVARRVLGRRSVS